MACNAPKGLEACSIKAALRRLSFSDECSWWDMSGSSCAFTFFSNVVVSGAQVKILCAAVEARSSAHCTWETGDSSRVSLRTGSACHTRCKSIAKEL